MNDFSQLDAQSDLCELAQCDPREFLDLDSGNVTIEWTEAQGQALASWWNGKGGKSV